MLDFEVEGRGGVGPLDGWSLVQIVDLLCLQSRHRKCWGDLHGHCDERTVDGVDESSSILVLLHQTR